MTWNKDGFLFISPNTNADGDIQYGVLVNSNFGFGSKSSNLVNNPQDLTNNIRYKRKYEGKLANNKEDGEGQEKDGWDWI